MSSGSEDFVFDGGNLALDFLNTRRLRRGRPIDQLSPGQRLPEWLRAAGLPGPSSLGGSYPDLRRLADEARLLRDAIEDAVLAFRAGAPLPRPSLHALNRALASSFSRLALIDAPDGLQLVESEEGDGVLSLLAPIAVAAADLLVTAKPARVRQCDSDRCVIWFLDGSKNGRRRWCSMARCGNRAKVSKHYRRSRTEAQSG